MQIIAITEQIYSDKSRRYMMTVESAAHVTSFRIQAKTAKEIIKQFSLKRQQMVGGYVTMNPLEINYK